MNTNFCVELSDDAAQNVSGGFNFGGDVNNTIVENFTITKRLRSNTIVIGNLAAAEATAVSFGPDTASQAITITSVVRGFGSSAEATSISASNGSLVLTGFFPF